MIPRHPAFPHRRQTQQPDTNPHKLAESPQEREGDARHVTVPERLEQQEIAGILGSSVGAVKANFFHALANLRKLLA